MPLSWPPVLELDDGSSTWGNALVLVWESDGLGRQYLHLVPRRESFNRELWEPSFFEDKPPHKPF